MSAVSGIGAIAGHGRTDAIDPYRLFAQAASCRDQKSHLDGPNETNIGTQGDQRTGDACAITTREERADIVYSAHRRRNLGVR
jgi:hypothetical protein